MSVTDLADYFLRIVLCLLKLVGNKDISLAARPAAVVVAALEMFPSDLPSIFAGFALDAWFITISFLWLPIVVIIVGPVILNSLLLVLGEPWIIICAPLAFCGRGSLSP